MVIGVTLEEVPGIKKLFRKHEMLTEYKLYMLSYIL